MGPSSAIAPDGCRVGGDPPAGSQWTPALLVAALLGGCGGQPDGALLEVHASLALDDTMIDQLRTYRVYRVEVEGAIREVARTGLPPDTFVVRAPEPHAASVPVSIRVLSFHEDGEDVLGCVREDDVALVDGATVTLDVTLAPGDCS